MFDKKRTCKYSWDNILKVRQNNNYTMVEGTNKDKVLQQYLGSSIESGEVSMLGFASKIENKQKFERCFSIIDGFLDKADNLSSALEEHSLLSTLIKKQN